MNFRLAEHQRRVGRGGGGEAVEERSRNAALHRKKSGHDGSPVVLGRVGLQLLVGVVAADESFHFAMVILLVHYDCGSPFISRVDGDGFVAFELLDGLALLARDVGRRGLAVL